MEFGMGLNGMSVKMSDFPERISISPTYRRKRDDDFYLVDRKAFPGKGTEYIRADVAQAMAAKAREEVPAEIGEVSVREAARVLLDAARIEPVHDTIVRSVHLTPFCAALRAIAERKDDDKKATPLNKR